MKAMILDTETTGLPKRKSAKITDNDNWPYIVQFSWLICDLEKGTIENVKDYIVQIPEGMDIPPDSTKIHGITTKQMREKGHPIKDILWNFHKDLKSIQYIVAHNLNFDKTIIRVELHRNGYPNLFVRKKYIEFCTMNYGTGICKLPRKNKWNGQTRLKPPKLIELYKILFDETPENLHNSLIDVLVCFRCFYKMIMNCDIFDINPIFRNYFMELTHQDMSGNYSH